VQYMHSLDCNWVCHYWFYFEYIFHFIHSRSFTLWVLCFRNQLQKTWSRDIYKHSSFRREAK